MPFSPHKKRVAVLRGGASPEYEASLQTGKSVLENMPEEFDSVDVFVSKDGVWHQGGFEMSPHKILLGVDAVWNCLHGSVGEDGTIQKLVADFGIPQAGSGHLSSAFGMNKSLAKNIFIRAGLKTPISLMVSQSEDSAKLFERIYKAMPFPIVVKPANSGSSMGLSIAKSHREMLDAVGSAFKISPNLLVEEYIEGKEVSSGVIEGFRDEQYYALLPISRSGLSAEESESVQQTARLAHIALGLEDFSQADFILHPRRGVYILEVNTLPKLHSESPFVHSLQSAGSNIKEFISHTLNKILRR